MDTLPVPAEETAHAQHLDFVGRPSDDAPTAYPSGPQGGWDDTAKRGTITRAATQHDDPSASYGG